MHKFKCEKCAGFCELIIDCVDLEEQLPFRCPSSNIDAEWVRVDVDQQSEKLLEPEIEAGVDFIMDTDLGGD